MQQHIEKTHVRGTSTRSPLEALRHATNSENAKLSFDNGRFFHLWAISKHLLVR